MTVDENVQAHRKTTAVGLKTVRLIRNRTLAATSSEHFSGGSRALRHLRHSSIARKYGAFTVPDRLASKDEEVSWCRPSHVCD